MSVSVSVEAGSLSPAIDDRLGSWTANAFGRRLWDRDVTLWADEPVDELADRLGWLDLPTRSAAITDELVEFGSRLAGDGVSDVVVLGMGGSSLAPEVFQAVYGNKDGWPRLSVLDSTHPASVMALRDGVDLARTVFIVSSKSGTTLETQSFLDYFWHEATQGGSTASRFVAVTDEGSPLEALARERGFLRVFTAPSDVGGRYSALTEFGLVPAAAIGAPVDRLGASARAAAAACGPSVPADESPALVLGALLGEGVLAGFDKATFIASPQLSPLVPWIEQLVAESTGKQKTGVVPVGGDDASVANSGDRTFVVIESETEPLDSEYRTLAGAGRPVARVTIADAEALGGLMFVLEFAVASAGAALGIQPFDQPDVQLAKELAAQAMEGDPGTSTAPATLVTAPDLVPRLVAWMDGLAAPHYAGIHAFLPPTGSTRAALEIARRALRDHRNVVATADFGPRFLHSTGQLHKGGPRNGHFLQVVDDPSAGLQVPGTDYTFDQLVRAQAVGDYHALVDRGQRVMRVELGDSGPTGLEMLMTAVVTAARG